MSLIQTLGFIVRHPLNRGRRLRALLRYVRWQVGSRLVPGAVAVPFVEDCRILVVPGLTGATGNLYCGLHEFEDMAFTLHFLRPGDTFVDIGANVGSYTLLASAAGARCLAFEPVPATFARLRDNVRLNALEDRVELRQAAIGARRERVSFTTTSDTMNHVAVEGASEGPTVAVDVVPLDEALGDSVPVLLKIDVEGFEARVLEGGPNTFADPRLRAVILELNGSGRRYGLDDADLHQAMVRWGFRPHRYDPLARRLEALPGPNQSGNTLYLRNPEEAQERLASARRFRVGEAVV